MLACYNCFCLFVCCLLFQFHRPAFDRIYSVNLNWLRVKHNCLMFRVSFRSWSLLNGFNVGNITHDSVLNRFGLVYACIRTYTCFSRLSLPPCPHFSFRQSIAVLPIFGISELLGHFLYSATLLYPISKCEERKSFHFSWKPAKMPVSCGFDIIIFNSQNGGHPPQTNVLAIYTHMHKYTRARDV